jgi:FdhD protein
LNQAIIYHTINRWHLAKGMEQIDDPMIIEKTLNIFVNGEFWRSIDCNPIFIDDLVIGAMALDNVIRIVEDIKTLIIEDTRVSVTLEPQANQIIKQAKQQVQNSGEFKLYPQVKAEQIVNIMNSHVKYSKIHEMTGGVHSMSLSDGENILVCREDIGRHNAVDKIIGYCLKNKIDCTDKIFLSSGRISREILDKIIFLGVKIIVSRATVTDLARSLAIDAGITLIGFTRNGRFNIYTNPERIDINK